MCVRGDFKKFDFDTTTLLVEGEGSPWQPTHHVAVCRVASQCCETTYGHGCVAKHALQTTNVKTEDARGDDHVLASVYFEQVYGRIESKAGMRRMDRMALLHTGHGGADQTIVTI